jgi:hypothetical protein
MPVNISMGWFACQPVEGIGNSACEEFKFGGLLLYRHSVKASATHRFPRAHATVDSPTIRIDVVCPIAPKQPW